jgi:hypothetical protein
VTCTSGRHAPAAELRNLYRRMLDLRTGLDATDDPDLAWHDDRPLLFALCDYRLGGNRWTDTVRSPIADRTWQLFPTAAVIAAWAQMLRAGKIPMPQDGTGDQLPPGAEVTGWILAHQAPAIPVAADATLPVLAALYDTLTAEDWRPARIIAAKTRGQRHMLRLAWLQHPEPGLPPVDIACECNGYIDTDIADAMRRLPYGTPGNLT